MALDVDGFQLLQAITARPDAFPDIGAEAARAGRGLVVKQLKAKGLDPAGLRLVRDALGDEAFALVVDGMTDAEVRGVVAKLDRHHPHPRSADSDWLRRHLVDLAIDVEPALKGTDRPSGAKPATGKAPRVVRALGSAAFAAAWDGKDHDPKPRKSKKKGG